MDPFTSVGKGWLRASHRKLDAALSTDYRPYHTHDEIEPLVPGDLYELDIEIWPTCIVVPSGYRVGLSVLGKDYLHDGRGTTKKSDFFGETEVQYGSGPFVHNDPEDRIETIFGGKTTVHIGPNHPNYLLVPVIPSRAKEGT
jgi:predicted acyl esterase